MSQTAHEDDEEDVGSKVRKAWFAGHVDATDTFGGSFRGTRPAPHGGKATVSPDDTTGSYELCWCGKPFDHNWPGKASGRPHPRKEATMPTKPGEQLRIERGSLRAYHADLADLIIQAVNEYQVKYRLNAHSVLLFPADGSPPYKIHARNTDRQLRAAQHWFVRHVVPKDKPIKKAAAKRTEVDVDALKELAAVMNSEEHLPPESEPQPEPQPEPEPEVVSPPTPVETPPVSPEDAEVSDDTPDDEWSPYLVYEGRPSQKEHPFYFINKAGMVKCALCDKVIGPKRSTGGHTRTHHTPTDTLWGPEAKAKAIDTQKTTKLAKRVAEAIETLQEAIGVTPEKVDVEGLTNEINQLKAQKADLQSQLTERSGKVAELEAKLADREAKDALIREALGL